MPRVHASISYAMQRSIDQLETCAYPAKYSMHNAVLLSSMGQPNLLLLRLAHLCPSCQCQATGASMILGPWDISLLPERYYIFGSSPDLF